MTSTTAPTPSARRNSALFHAAHRASPYDEIANLSEEVTRSRMAFTGLVAATPYRISRTTWASHQARHAALRDWHTTSLKLLEASIKGRTSDDLARSLLDHLPPHVGWQHHHKLPLSRIQPPCFFRTDQTADGVIFEVQCPGSLWGVHELLREFHANDDDAARRSAPLSAAFGAALLRRVGEHPIIHHLLDNSSHPAGERFFIQRARQHASYFGYDDVRPMACNFVRAHDYFSLLVENFAARRLERMLDGEIHYDLPPVALFDQKLLLTLPFDHQTREHYSDNVRALFPYTALLRPQGIQLEDGSIVTIEQFSALPRTQRNFFLKYAGSDVHRNWGSQSVFHLGKQSREHCESMLKGALQRFDHGERWLLQREQITHEAVTYLDRSGEHIQDHAHSKHSVFYGPDGAMASLVMFEQFYKVHGSSDTVTTIGLPSDDQESLPS